ncbi:MAG TPA: hypothetical protein VK540_06175 [Polyangiaceae bacterium]|nr:hypothetical protein [Polyangiaceae bacterium]
MGKWLVLLAVAAIGCSPESTSSKTTGRPTGTTGPGGSGGSGSGSGGTGGGTPGGPGGSSTGTAGGNTGGTSGAGGAGGAGGTGGSAGGSGGTGGTAGSTGGSSGSGGGTGGTAGDPDGGVAPDAAGGTGGGDASPPDAAVDEQQACTNFADTFCSRLQTCSAFVMSVLYGDVATCKQRWFLNCRPNFGVTGTSASAAKTNGCTQTLPALACDKFLLGDFGTACTASPGTLPQGAACGDDAQCATTFCARSATSLCGTCQPATNPGDPCPQGSCSVSTNTVCREDGTTCIKPKTGPVGAACVGQEECDVGHQVGCNTANRKCVALTLAASGGQCGANSVVATSIAVCSAGGTCTLALAGRCTAFAADGQTCSTADTGAHCMQPAKCVGGRCAVPDPGSCK